MAAPDPIPPDPSEANPLATDCRRCPALVDCRTRISWGVGPTDAALVVVGEAPGAGAPDRERWRGGNHSGMAYTAANSGRKVRSLVRDVGYEGDAYYTNAVKCFPCDGEGSNREPTAEERANCRPYLVGEVETVTPDCVLATGKHATQSLFAVGGRSLDGFLDSVLEAVHVDGLVPPVVPLVHPSYQEVWIPRLGYEYEGYVAALGETLAEL
ncbi:uracil-DNA glycosylase [Salinirubellus salinus]|uniref:Uracil-DNA glycosylase n=1 Tax=Salinirubellus salinus TaxID=1364945 RepID=A0A9E7R008_9EURY|nr:uracil-DNA glycosylase family protein [Salinirubellus salinus]UWM53127.1 uracil-DNA glycosylase [Salinirubellus salinus]